MVANSGVFNTSISWAQLSGAGPKSLGVHEVGARTLCSLGFGSWGLLLCSGFGFLPDKVEEPGSGFMGFMSQLLLPALMGAFFPSPWSFWSQLLGFFIFIFSEDVFHR